MLGEFHRADLATIPDANDTHTSTFETRYEFRIHAVVAVVTSLGDLQSINGAQPGARQKSDRMKVVQRGRIIRPSRQRAVQRCHNAIQRTRVIFRGVRICDPQNIPRMLYQSILKATQVPVNGTLRARAYSMPRNMPTPLS